MTDVHPVASEVAVVAAVNDHEVLRKNLLASPMFAKGEHQLATETGHLNAGRALNAGIARVTAPVVACVHQDVYLPAGWDSHVVAAAEYLRETGEPWGVLGVWGLKGDGGHAGRVWCSGGNREYRQDVFQPTPVVSVDEIVIVLNVEAGLRFDDNLPGFHLYGTDIIAQAHARGLRAYVFNGPVVHNSRANVQVFDQCFFAAYRYMQKKWRHKLPLRTCTVPVTAMGWPLYRAWLKREWRKRRKTARHGRLECPWEQAARLGYE